MLEPDDRDLLDYNPIPDLIRFHEPYQNIFFYSTAVEFQTAKLMVNRRFVTTGRASISYFYKLLNMPSNREFDQIGWTKEDGIENNYQFIDISEEYVTDVTPTDEDWFEIKYIIIPTFIGEED